MFYLLERGSMFLFFQTGENGFSRALFRASVPVESRGEETAGSAAWGAGGGPADVASVIVRRSSEPT